ncbi:hypothetical protein, partial [Microcystis aeruginosa]|uniref:hypothetical protein n=1 Tax=Microcystis aeruginosa TaxID=1126 RepID=UPI0005C4C6DC
FSIYFVNALIFNSKAAAKQRGFRPKIFDEGFAGRHGFPIIQKVYVKSPILSRVLAKKNRLWEAGVKGITPEK